MLAETGLTLAGERPWAAGDLAGVPMDTSDALAFMSSNASTLAEAVLACLSLDRNTTDRPFSEDLTKAAALLDTPADI